MTAPTLAPTPAAPAAPARRRSPAAWVVAGLIRTYQRLMSWSAPRCRFHPSCSQYALEAVELHGATRGGWLAVRRLGRCHPWHPGGLDPVPDPRPNTSSVEAGSE